LFYIYNFFDEIGGKYRNDICISHKSARRYLIQPPAAALAAKRKAVCFTSVTLLLFIHFIVEAHISALDGRIFVILVSFDRFSVPFLYFIHKSDRSAPWILQGVKTAKFWAVLSRFYRLDCDHSKTAQFFGTLKQTYSAQATGLSYSKVWYRLPPVFEIRPGVCGPKMCENGKWATRKPITLKMAEDKTIQSASEKEPKGSSFLLANFVIIRFRVFQK